MPLSPFATLPYDPLLPASTPLVFGCALLVGVHLAFCLDLSVLYLLDLVLPRTTPQRIPDLTLFVFLPSRLYARLCATSLLCCYCFPLLLMLLASFCVGFLQCLLPPPLRTRRCCFPWTPRFVLSLAVAASLCRWFMSLLPVSFLRFVASLSYAFSVMPTCSAHYLCSTFLHLPFFPS